MMKLIEVLLLGIKSVLAFCAPFCIWLFVYTQTFITPCVWWR
uniref:Uncharacterized protein n=1 Tax=Rhizophora mucronata TaxID=61149 RepID=A0A2P2QRB0_RHIMU